MSEGYEYRHQPVLLEPALAYLAVRPDGIYVDCTLGGGGHAAAILTRLGRGGRLIALDRDSEALAAGKSRLEEAGSAADWQVVQGNFADLAGILAQMGITRVHGILADLGVSSWQLDQPQRGFAYSQDGPLDMRMNREIGRSAADLVNSLSKEELTHILHSYGEERHAARISQAIIDYRSRHPFRNTSELAAVVRGAMPKVARQEAQHPARRTFQALRIEVNQELQALEKLLADAPGLLEPAGRLCVITFHSLEDRMVKDVMKSWENPCICPRSFPVCACGRKPIGRMITAKAITADAQEKEENPRARSAKLRCFAYQPQVEGGAS
jgi:16S rRNA (cytosine1402-N4)-methyltransferase